MEQNTNCEYDNEEIIEENGNLIHKYHSKKYDESRTLDTYTEFTGNHKVDSKIITEAIEELNLCIASNTYIDTEELYHTSKFFQQSEQYCMCEYKLLGKNIETPVTSEIIKVYLESVEELITDEDIDEEEVEIDIDEEEVEIDIDEEKVEINIVDNLPFEGYHKDKPIKFKVKSTQIFEYELYTITFRT